MRAYALIADFESDFRNLYEQGEGTQDFSELPWNGAKGGDLVIPAGKALFLCGGRNKLAQKLEPYKTQFITTEREDRGLVVYRKSVYNWGKKQQMLIILNLSDIEKPNLYAKWLRLGDGSQAAMSRMPIWRLSEIVLNIVK